MKIRMLSTAAGADGCYMAGQIVDVDPETAVNWINGGYAEPVTQTVEQAVIEPGEKAITHDNKKASNSTRKRAYNRK